MNLNAARDIINSNGLALNQTDRLTLKFPVDNGYVMLNTKSEIVTVVRFLVRCCIDRPRRGCYHQDIKIIGREKLDDT